MKRNESFDYVLAWLPRESLKVDDEIKFYEQRYGKREICGKLNSRKAAR